MLLPTEVDLILQKRGYKRNSVWPSDSTDGKMVLTLLTEVVILYVGPTTIDNLGLGFEHVSRSTF